jgi:predicted small secreted protein
MIRSSSAVLSLCAALVALSACNTFEGVGEDVKQAGEAVSTSAQKVKQKINEQ